MQILGSRPNSASFTILVFQKCFSIVNFSNCFACFISSDFHQSNIYDYKQELLIETKIWYTRNKKGNCIRITGIEWRMTIAFARFWNISICLVCFVTCHFYTTIHYAQEHPTEAQKKQNDKEIDVALKPNLHLHISFSPMIFSNLCAKRNLQIRPIYCLSHRKD